MRIGIDARFYGMRSGLGRYTTKLVDYIAAHPDNNEYHVFVSTRLQPQPAPHLRVIRTRIRWYGLLEQVLLPFLLYRYGLQLMHFVHWNVPILYRRPYLVTIHDLILVHFPDSNASTRRKFIFFVKYRFYRIVLSNALRHARRIVAVSQFTQRDIEQTFPMTRGRVVVVYEGSDGTLGATPDRRLADRLPQPYLLYVGNAYPHKNLLFLLTEFTAWRARNPDAHLVLAGPTDFFYRRLSDYAAGRFDNVRFFGEVNDAQLAALYARAHAYVFPSLYEGFGLPALEAMGHGVPVLSSNSSCLPEILGDAAAFFDPRDGADFRRALDEVMYNKRQRAIMRDRGLERARTYRWERMGEELLRLYQRLQS